MKFLGPWTLMLAAVAVTAGFGCSLVINDTAEQCTSDADCSTIGGRCQLETGTCVDDQTSGPGGGGTGGNTGMGGEGGTTGDPCLAENKPQITIEGSIDANTTFECVNDYLIKGRVFVTDGATLTIQAATTIKGKFSADPLNASVLVVQPGAQIRAIGTADRPIVFTSEKEPAFRVAGDWGGLIILGNAQVNEVAPVIEGITSGGEYGGNDDDDDSGVLRYVRIEYSGAIIGANNEINGLTFGGVGRNTEVDFVQVRLTLDDCFEFFGGTVNAKHLVCQHNEDDGLDWDLGYRGKIQFAVVQQKPNFNESMHGIEADNSSETATPKSAPTLYNLTLIGNNASQADTQYGMVLREWTDATIRNALVMGFDYGWDVRDDGTGISLQNSIFVDQVIANIADPAEADDDNGFDEITVFNQAGNQNSESSPGFSVSDATNANTFSPIPPAAITGDAATPPTDGFFDDTATFIGAVRDPTDNWVTEGSWVVWSPN